MNNLFKIQSKYTNKNGYVIKITKSKIFVTFVGMKEYCVPVNLKSLKRDFIVDKEDLKTIKQIREEAKQNINV